MRFFTPGLCRSVFSSRQEKRSEKRASEDKKGPGFVSYLAMHAARDAYTTTERSSMMRSMACASPGMRKVPRKLRSTMSSGMSVKEKVRMK